MRAIPLNLKERINKANQTIYENANPHMDVVIRKSMNDTDQFYVETIREKTGLGDIGITLLRTNSDKAPTYAYEIHNDNGIIKTTIRKLADYSNERWKHQFDVGKGKACSIEFDGYWVQDKKYRFNLVTEKTPYIFWTDNNNGLWCQKWDDINTKIQLATDVLKIATIRGWKNTQGEIIDQGLICAYIKTGGKAYYRAYAQQTDKTLIWEAERELTQFTPPVSSIGLFRTNDFRIGFVAKTNDGIYMSVTRRAYSGMSVDIENVTAKPVEVGISLIPIKKSEFKLQDGYVTAVPNLEVQMYPANYTTPAFIDGSKLTDKTLYVECNYPLANYTGEVKNFTANNYTITNITQGDTPNKLVITTSEILTTGVIEVKYNGTGNLRAVILDPVGKYPLGQMTYTIPGEPPKDDEYVTVTPLTVGLVLTKVNYINTNLVGDQGCVTATPSNIELILTKVADNPL